MHISLFSPQINFHAQSASFALSIFLLWVPNEIKYTQLRTTRGRADLLWHYHRAGRLQVKNTFAISNWTLKEVIPQWKRKKPYNNDSMKLVKWLYETRNFLQLTFRNDIDSRTIKAVNYCIDYMNTVQRWYKVIKRFIFSSKH